MTQVKDTHMATPAPPTPTIPRAPSHIVGLGASAGGLEALELFFANMPAQNGMAFVVAQHLSPDFKSLMDQLLGRHTRMAIRRVEDGMPMEADTIYLIQPRAEWRRIRRRLGIVNVPDVDAYIHLLRASPQELSALHKDLLIGVTSFFHNPEAFGVLSLLHYALQSQRHLFLGASGARQWHWHCA
jgi:hypothetical protein